MTDDELGETEPDDSDDMAEEEVMRGPEPVRDPDQYAQGRADAQSAGAKIRAKLKRGTGTRDQDEIVIEGRGVNAQEAADDFEQALMRVEQGDWMTRLRELQDEER